MVIYFLLIAFVLVCPTIMEHFNTESEKKRKWVVIISVGAIYLLCALKSTDVGIDIPGYQKAYIQAGQHGWFDTSYIYFEKGYIFIEKLFNILGFSFQTYLAVIYAIVFIPVGIFIYKYSSNVTISCVVYICYQILVFNISGIRQSIATSMCLVAYMCLDKKKFESMIEFVVIVLMATQVHRSAIIFLLAFFARKMKLNVPFLGGTLIFFLGSLMFRSNIVTYLNQYAGKYQAGEEMTLGGNFTFLLATMLLLLFLFFVYHKELFTEGVEAQGSRYYCTDEFATSTIIMITFTVIAQLVLNGGLLRGANYYSVFMILAIPDISMYFDSKSEKIYNALIVIFMIILFYTQTLSINQFNCVPYRFFWQ